MMPVRATLLPYFLGIDAPAGATGYLEFAGQNAIRESGDGTH